jgi:hypothetical protein
MDENNMLRRRHQEKGWGERGPMPKEGKNTKNALKRNIK